MSFWFLAPLPIVLSTLAADALSPETQVPLGWVLAGFGVSLAVTVKAVTSYNKTMACFKAQEEHSKRTDRLLGDLARNFYAMEKRFEDLAREHATCSACSATPADEKTPGS